MGIRVVCPKGHRFKVKDKYAGKRGLCPHCTDKTYIQVPDLMSASQHGVDQVIEHEHPKLKATSSMESGLDPGSSHVFDEPFSVNQSAESSGSILSGSLIQHNTMCHKCGARAPMWFAKCPQCGEFLKHE